MNVVVATHGHCFDGLTSALAFSWLLKQVEGANQNIAYHACGYAPGQKVVTAELLRGDVNAILDYRFFASDSLTWYFDHHRTAFATEEDAAYLREHQGERRYFFDSEYSSCAKLIMDTARTQFGLDTSELSDLVRWADKVDSANFESAEAAIDRSSHIMRLVSVVEQHGGDQFLTEVIPLLLKHPLEKVARLKQITKPFAAISRRQTDYTLAVEKHAKERGRVVLVDLSEHHLKLIGKFVTYALYPSSMYSVVVARMRKGYKISVGYNPWCGHALDTDISALCARYGGGGHKFVGGISVPEGQGDRARQIAETLAAELAG